MKRIVIGLTANAGKSLKHKQVEVVLSGAYALLAAEQGLNGDLSKGKGSPLATLSAGNTLRLSAQENTLQIGDSEMKGMAGLSTLILKPLWTTSRLTVYSPNRLTAKTRHTYSGELVAAAEASSLRLFVQVSLEDYLFGVLSSEVPASYHLEAIKAQAVAARTYALNPRVDHHPDNCQVCDSFLCCQCFLGCPSEKKDSFSEAIAQTSSQVLVYQDKPILALFSACAGGHTENYDSCFSDRVTNAFPPKPLPYLKGVPEGKLPADFRNPPDEKALATLWHLKNPDTVDAWASQFRWSIRLPGDSIEANMHHIVEGMLKKDDVAPFVIPPPSGVFGHVKSFHIDSRGVGGTAVTMTVKTDKGNWLFKKELVIRSVFENREIKLPRLKSARIYFQHQLNDAGLLSCLTIYGLGTGHGVGLQQTGAEGMARIKKAGYRAILQHYFSGSEMATV